MRLKYISCLSNYYNTMKRSIFTLLLLLLINSTAFSQTPEVVSVKENPDASTFYFIRHAEKDRTNPLNKNPDLTTIGHERAIKWRQVLGNIPFNAVYTTDYNRTKQTAHPIATANKLPLYKYDVNTLDVDAFLKQNTDKHVLVVGHSNTTPQFVNAILGKEKYPQIADNNNANLYVVTIINGVATSSLLLVN